VKTSRALLTLNIHLCTK